MNLIQLWQDRRGAFAPVTALCLTALISFAALAVDMGFNYYTRNKLQVTADASALAGASQLEFLPDQAPMVAAAVDYADKNMDFAEYGSVLVAGDVVAGNWDPDTRTFTAALEPMNAVMTTTRQEDASGNAVPAFLGGIAGFSSYDVSASAIATYGQGDDLFPGGCIMALNESEEDAFYIFGTASITTADCSIEVASSDPCAMHAHGTPTVTTVENEDGSAAEPINVVGGYCEQGPVAINPEPVTGYDGDVRDPYRNNPDPCENGLVCEPAADDPCEPTAISGTATLSPGIYCGGIIWTGNGTATFEPGDYVIKDGPLDIGGNMAVEGEGVGFYLTGDGSVVNMKGTSDVSLSAQPTDPDMLGYTGSPLSGYVFYEDPDNAQQTHTLRGTNGGAYQGVLYFNGDVELKGTADGGLSEDESDCTVLIADTVYFNGTTGLDADSTCESLGGAPAGVGDMVVRLVE